MTDDVRGRAIELYDRFTHEGMDRRAFMAELTKLAGSTAAANALLIGIAANPAAAAIVPANDKRLRIRTLEWEVSQGRRMKGYNAAPAKAAETLPVVIVIHENRGLTEHIRDVARRVALAGYSAVAPDFLTPGPGTPADEDQAREMIGKLDLGQTTSDAVGMVRWLGSPAGGSRKVGTIGFCWGGAMVNRLAAAAGPALAAGVSYYGPAPAPSEAVKVRAPLLIHLAGNDQRVNTTAQPWANALKAAAKDVTLVVHPKVEHAFNNDTSAERYNKPAADRAWRQTLDFFGRHLRA
jgi:carboxymethylenebutenolidase